MAAPFDTLKLARRFEAAGLEARQAGDMAQAIADAIGEAVVTKADLAASVAELKLSIADVKLAIRDVKIWTGSVAAAAMTILFAALHLWPPH